MKDSTITEAPTHSDTVSELLPDAPLLDIERELEELHEQKSTVPVIRQLIVAIGLLVAVFGITYAGTILAPFDRSNQSEEVIVEAQLGKTDIYSGTKQNVFDGTKIIARSAFVWDVRDQRVLFNKNADEMLPLASVTKLMTALVAYELLDEDQDIDISVDAIRQEGDSGFSASETFSLQNLSDITLIASSNDGAYALSAQAGATLVEDNDPNRAFVKAMNIRAEELGLTNTRFQNATGLDISPIEAGAHGSARDMAFLMEYIITHYPNVLALTKIDFASINNENGDYHLTKNTNEIVESIDGLIASKTGYTELAGGNLVIAFNAGLNRPFIVSVLGSSREGRFEDVLDLIDRTRAYVLSEK